MDVHAFRDLDALSRYAAAQVVAAAKEAVLARQRFLLALSGGSTPALLFQLLAQTPYALEMPWQATHVLWGDERLVAPDADGSNYRQAKTMLLHEVGVPAAHIHRIKGELEPSEAALDYAATLAELAEDGKLWPRLDLALMGMGSDGHTASLFPGHTAALEARQPVAVVVADYEGRPSNRITLTPPVFNDARQLLFLVTGASKAPMVARVLASRPDDASVPPAARLRPAAGHITWLLDQEAAAEVDPSTVQAHR